MEPTREELVELCGQLAHTSAEEIDCDEVLGCVSAYLEASSAGTPLTPELQAVAQHLKVCPGCLEEFLALVRSMQSE